MPTGGPLSDLVVLDLSRALAGPIAGRLLADLGAEVIKIEPPAGDLTRFIVPRVDGLSIYFVQCNVGKQCVSFDLACEAGRSLFLRLVERADIVLENYRPGVMARLGLDYQALRAVNPRIILVSITGWGHGNSRAEQGAYAAAIHAETGVTERIARERGEAPRNDPMSHADVYAGLHALAALLAAVHMRSRTGTGQAVEVSMAESTLVANDMVAVELSGLEPDEGFRGGQHRTPIYALSDGRPVNVLLDPTTDGGFALWCKAIDRPDLGADARFATARARAANRAALDGVLGPWVASFASAAEVEAAIGVSAVAVAEVRSVAELAATEWAAERGAFVDVPVADGTEVRVPQAPWRFSDAPTGVVARVGHRGEDNRAVLGGVASASEIDELEACGVVSARIKEAGN